MSKKLTTVRVSHALAMAFFDREELPVELDGRPVHYAYDLAPGEAEAEIAAGEVIAEFVPSLCRPFTVRCIVREVGAGGSISFVLDAGNVAAVKAQWLQLFGYEYDGELDDIADTREVAECLSS